MEAAERAPMANPPPQLPLCLSPLVGPAIADLIARGDGPVVIGRSASCELTLQDDSVSRRHATLVRKRGQWFVLDEGSSGGTFVNGHRIEKGHPTPVGAGDLVRIGPWAFRAALGERQPSSLLNSVASTIDDSSVTGQRVQRAGAGRLGRSERRLRLLSDAIARLNGVTSEAAAATAALESVILGSGYTRGAVLRRAGAGEVEVVASMRADPGDRADFTFSRSLIEQANGGETVVLSSTAPMANYGQSIAELEIHSAMCVPVGLGGSITGYLYLDARGHESQVKSDASTFCESIAIAYGLAVANIQRAELARRQAEMQAELTAAREVQKLVMPPEQGEVGCITYAARSLPGSFVAGDLFDVVDVAGEGVALCVGDVSGHGAGSAMLMAAAQSFLSAELRRLAPGQDAVVAVEALNRYLCERPLGGRFLSLWVGVLMPDGTLTYIDAGHGHWAVLRAGGEVDSSWDSLGSGGIPVGVEPDFHYTRASVRLGAGDRMLVYSDGIVEQRGQGGQQFGASRLQEATKGPGTPAADVDRLFQALGAFSPGLMLDDDATAASLGLSSNTMPEPAL
jgi:sigma-B regulation protein RsbU (phosphoserine phosphatase)